ncbi:IS200/IS605 family element transposase accessory protein TnpB [Candidatus Gracilibacteria bacterium]|nr:IS200/IS605 family element transposase accessory protein TnpB [Candidatus Gracilibacteria bacterium]NJM89065.1 IS200/IS605 family element transposase accessory protein TnpB [Hydrococcus sp. RU_2_2]
MFRVVKVRLYPTESQQIRLAQWFGCCRWFWNYSLDLTTKTYQQTGKGLSRVQIQSMLPALKKEYEWLAEPYSQCLQFVALTLSQAFLNFFEKRAKYPNFKSKRSKQSISFPQNVQIIDKGLKLPKLGVVEAKLSKLYPGEVKTVTISKNPSEKYYASILFEIEGEEPSPSTDGKAIGLDLGLTHFCITSDGSQYNNPKHLYKHQRNLARKQKKLSRKNLGSRSRHKAVKLVATIHEKIFNTRRDFLHKLSSKIVNENQVIVVEDLAVLNMVRNHKLAKAISDCSWGTFTTFLKYKCERNGKVFVKVDRFFPSSKTCSNCYHQVTEMPLDVRSWQCPKCGTNHDRDVNAATNIKDEGLRLLALGHSATASGGRVRPSKGFAFVRQHPMNEESHATPSG